MSYRDYEVEEHQKQRRQKMLEEKTNEIRVQLDKGELAQILSELSLGKENKTYF